MYIKHRGRNVHVPDSYAKHRRGHQRIGKNIFAVMRSKIAVTGTLADRLKMTPEAISKLTLNQLERAIDRTSHDRVMLKGDALKKYQDAEATLDAEVEKRYITTLEKNLRADELQMKRMQRYHANAERKFIDTKNALDHARKMAAYKATQVSPVASVLVAKPTKSVKPVMSANGAIELTPKKSVKRLVEKHYAPKRKVVRK